MPDRFLLIFDNHRRKLSLAEITEVQERFEKEMEERYGGEWIMALSSYGGEEGVYFTDSGGEWQIFGDKYPMPDGMPLAIVQAHAIAVTTGPISSFYIL